jgi:hypothetical protein
MQEDSKDLPRPTIAKLDAPYDEELGEEEKDLHPAGNKPSVRWSGYRSRATGMKLRVGSVRSWS